MGTIRKRGDSYQADWCVDGIRKRKTFKLQREAKEFLSRVDVSVADGTYVDPNRYKKNNLAMLIKRYIETYGKQRGFAKSKIYQIRKIEDFFGVDTLLMTLRKNRLQDFRNHLESISSRHKRPFTVASVNRAMSCLSHMLSCAVDWEMMPSLPFKGASSILRKRENNSIDRFLSEDEITRLVAASDGYLKDMIICGINSGMRFDEIRTLKWSQIREVFIYLTQTKSDKPRQIPINEDLDALFKRIRQREGLRSEYVFTLRGRPLNSYVNKAFSQACNRAGIPFGRRQGGITFHSLRHTFASHVAMKTGNLKIVKELLGHSDLKTTERYAHLTDSTYQQAVDALNGLTSQEVSKSQNVTSGVVSMLK